MAELATQEVKLFGKWSFDDVEVRFYFGNVVGGVVISQTRTTTVPRNGVMPKCFFFFSPFFAELSRARARWKGRRRDARSARGGRESRGDDIFEFERCRATCGATRPTTREAQMCPRHIRVFFSPGLFGLLFCPSIKTPVVLLRVSQREMIMHIINKYSLLLSFPFYPMIPTHKQINDISLEDYIAVKPKYATFVPHTAGRYAAKRFRKAQCPIVERIVNSLMMHGRNNGKKLMAARIVRHAMDIIFLLTDQNPLQVIVDAVINAGPREDATRVGSAGVVRRQAVDISPLRRVNDAIYLLTTGAREAAFRNVKTMAECLADELVNAAKGSSNSYAIKKKDELERVAKANR